MASTRTEESKVIKITSPNTTSHTGYPPVYFISSSLFYYYG